MANDFIYPYRLPFMRELTPQETASAIIDVQRRNHRNKGIPAYWLPGSKILRYVKIKYL